MTILGIYDNFLEIQGYYPGMQDYCHYIIH